MNDFLRRLVDAAEANGWTLLAVDGHVPGGFVTVADRQGNEITIKDRNHGLDLLAYVSHLTPLVIRVEA